MHLAPGEYRKNHPCSCRALFCLLAFREDDLIHKEEDDHGDAAVEHGGANVVDEVWHQQPSHRHPDAVDGVDDAGNDAERQQIPAHLICNVAFAAEPVTENQVVKMSTSFSVTLQGLLKIRCRHPALDFTRNGIRGSKWPSEKPNELSIRDSLPGAGVQRT